MSGILAGIRVLEWGIAHTVPSATTMLGDLGADVIKIEPRLTGDPHRGLMRSSTGVRLQAAGGRSYYFEGLNRGKRSITLDLKKESGRQAAYRLVEKSDVFVTNFRRNAINGCGMSYEILRSHNPRLIYASASGYGPKGPDSSAPGFDLAAQARAGFMTIGKTPDEIPSSPIGLADQAGSVGLALGILGALLARERFGVGQELHVSLLSAMMWLENTPLLFRLLAGDEPHPCKREEATNPLWNIYRTRDGKWVCVSHGYWGAGLWAEFCQAMGITELQNDPRFNTHEKRIQDGKELIAVLDRVFATRTRDEWLEVAREHDLIFQPVNTLSDLVTDAQVLENGYIVDYDHPVLGKIKLPGFPVEFSQTPAQVARPAPDLGQDTEAILREVAGCTPADIQRLRAEEAI